MLCVRYQADDGVLGSRRTVEPCIASSGPRQPYGSGCVASLEMKCDEAMFGKWQ